MDFTQNPVPNPCVGGSASSDKASLCGLDVFLCRHLLVYLFISLHVSYTGT